MVSAVSRIVVPFHGATSGVGELTWGQREIWTAMLTQRSWLPIFFVQPLASGTSAPAKIVSQTAAIDVNRSESCSGRPRGTYLSNGGARERFVSKLVQLASRLANY